jgi:hypothetical protein
MLFLWAAPLLAQTAPAPSSRLERRMDSGPVENRTDEHVVLARFSVEEPGALWLRLYFEELELGGDEASGKGSYLRISSMLDGASQVLRASSAAQWGYSSAYMNGDAVLVELIGAPRSGISRMRLQAIDAGFAVLNSICGATDDRVLATDPRAARAMPVGCTAWMISDCGRCFLTAGHCMSGNNLSVVQFNVPPSSSSGGLQNPPPEDQYAVDLLRVSSSTAASATTGAISAVSPTATRDSSPSRRRALPTCWPTRPPSTPR